MASDSGQTGPQHRHLTQSFERDRTIATTITTNSETRVIAELATAAQAGDREAFGDLFQRYKQQVFAIGLRRLGDYCEAQELCQDVFVQAFVKLDQLRDPERFGAWIRSIAHRRAINRAVRRGPALAAEPSTLEAMDAHDATPLNNVLALERQGRLRDGLARLRTLDRQTLEAFYVKGQSLQEMCGDFKAPLGTIKRRLHVARKRLAKQVEQLTAV